MSKSCPNGIISPILPTLPTAGREAWSKGVMGGDSRSEGRGFESRHYILYGHFSHIFVVKNCDDVCLKRPKINEKEAGVVPFF